MSSEKSLEKKIIEYLRNNPGAKGRIIAQEIGADKNKVNSLLYNDLQSKCEQDEEHKWYLENQNSKKTTSFAKEVTKYFLDFLETDFKKRRTPKRCLKLRDSDNLKLGLRLGQYPKFSEKLSRAVKDQFSKNIQIKKGQYKKEISQDLFNLIEIDINEEVNEEKVENIIRRVEKVILKAENERIEDPEEFVVNVLEKTKNIVKRELIDGLVQEIKKSIRKKEGGSVVYSMKEDLSEIVFNQIREELRKLTIKKIASNEDVSIEERMNNLLSVSVLQEEFISFFDNFKVNDLFSEIYQLKNNQQIKEKVEFYFYFFDINFDKKTYPLFYIPVSVIEKKEDDQRFFEIDFLDKVYINKKAIEYITENFNRKKDSADGSVRSIKNRIIYLNEESLKGRAETILDELISYFRLHLDLNLYDKEKESKGDFVSIRSNYYFALFDKSDENLVNDYEALLQFLGEKEEIGDKFENLVNDFIENEPEKVIEEIDNEWDKKEIEERLVAKSPTPLNEEQRKILQALNRKDCNYLLVEGPPGTGKSHTITSIVFEAIQKDLSVLVLSDKKEALDVVENKITNTLQKVRTGKNFQNPILRIGKKKKNLGQILAKSSIKKIRNNYRTIKKEGGVNEELNKDVSSLKREIKEQINSTKKIDFEKVIELAEIENKINDLLDLFSDFRKLNEENIEEANLTDLHEAKEVFLELQDFKNNKKVLFNFLFGIDFNFEDVSLEDFQNNLASLKQIKNKIEDTKSIYPFLFQVVDLIEDVSKDKFNSLKKLILEFEEIKNNITFKLNPFKKKKIAKFNRKFTKLFPRVDLDIFEDFKSLKQYVEGVEYFKENLDIERVDFNFVVYSLTSKGQKEIKETEKLKEQLNFITNTLNKYPKTFNNLGIDLEKVKTLFDNKLIGFSEGRLNLLVKYIKLKRNLNLDKIKEVNYLDKINRIQNLSTLQMSYLMDKKLINFYDKNSSTAKTLQKIIQKGKRFPAENFEKMKNAFPCILAEIRNYSEYIPMTPDLFDLVIIDEASQVSIAQAFPALIRGKKVAIFGDKKQFGNVKSIQAKKKINNEYKNNIESEFRNNIGTESDKLERLNYIDVKNSILDLFEFINNYEIQLSKYFRGYREIISFSNKYFYNESLQVMKIRERPIQEVIKFTEVEHDGKIEKYKNANIPEIEKIIEKLIELKEEESKLSVGIITPFRNQQKLLHKKIRNHKYSDYFFDELDLKIMTFDSCQGEERDIIFYSMVASHSEDKLWSIFPSKISREEDKIRSSLRLQRLNVGFSRAKETMHFVLSKQIEDLSCDAVKESLQHYKNELDRASEEKGVEKVDPKSEMEPKVLNWLYQTSFYKKNRDNIELKPQFELGKYLSQIDPEYNHPNYVVDFLLVFTNEGGKKDKIIIEYDGLKEHFQNIENVNKFNYEDYYKEEDLYRQKCLEGYGYKFLRFNKFNLKDDPIQTMSEELKRITSGVNIKSKKVKEIRKKVAGLENGDYKICSECGKTKNIEKFRDDSLKTGYGRKCRECKGLNKRNTKERPVCPSCGCKMILREGRYGKFWGCTNFPSCEQTKKYNK